MYKLKVAKATMRDGKTVKQQKLLQCRVPRAVIQRMKFSNRRDYRRLFRQKEGIILVWLVMFIGTALAFFTDPIVLVVLVLSCAIGVARPSVFCLLPLTALAKLYAAWHGYAWRRTIGLPQSQEVPNYFYELFVLSILCILVWNAGRMVSHKQIALPKD